MTSNCCKEAFLSSAAAGRILPVYAEIPFFEPALVYETLSPGRGGILLESVKGPPKIARYSFVVFDPYLCLKAKDGEVTVSSTGASCAVSFRPPLDRLKDIIDAYPQKPEPGLPPFQGGAVGFLSYDFVRYLENIPRNATDDLNIPDAHFFIFDKLIAFDHLTCRAWVIIAPAARRMELGYGSLSAIDWEEAYEKAACELSAVTARLGAPCSSPAQSGAFETGPAVLNYEMTKDRYMDIVGRTKEYIAAGDIFQANLSQRISAPLGNRRPWDIYKTLRKINPSPFAAYADFGDYLIVSSSPERLVRVKGVTIDTRPIAGTRPRGKDLSEDAALRTDLLLNEKERAEHIMLIDLERNDIGRVSEYGSVAVDEFMITEDYSHVIHIVSNVVSGLKKGKTCFDVIKAVFPGGTITGVPKIRCMEIIDELEPTARGPYTGSLGYIGFSGDMDLNIIIRTFVIKDGRAYVQAGAGIVADSDPEREYYETLKKAEALLKTLLKSP